MEKKKQKKVLNRIKAKKIVDKMDVRMVKLNKYDIKKDLSDNDYMFALRDFMILNNRNWIPEKKDSYTKETPYIDIVKDFLSLQHLGIKEETIESLNMDYPEFWELLPSNEETNES